MGKQKNWENGTFTMEKIIFKHLFFLREERQGGEVIKGREWALLKADLCLNPSSTLEPV